MALPVFRGTNLPLLQNSKQSFDPVRGWITTYKERGVSESVMKASVKTAVDAGVAIDLTRNQGGTWDIDAVDATASFTQDTWQIIGTELENDLLLNPAINYIYIGLAAKDQIIYRNALQALDQTWIDVYESMQDTDHGDLLESFYSLKLQGTQGYRVQQYVLKHTTNAPSNYDANIADVGVDCIYAPAQLLSEITSSTWTNPCPSRIQYKISHIPMSPPVTATGYLWGWLKSASTETKSPFNRIQIETEYTLYSWPVQPNGLYPAFTG